MKDEIKTEIELIVSGTDNVATYTWHGGYLGGESSHSIGTNGTGDGDCNANRMYMSFTLPSIPLNPRIKKAELKFTQANSSSPNYEHAKFGLYHVTENITTGEPKYPAHAAELIDYERFKQGQNVEYIFDVTALVDKLHSENSEKVNLVLKMFDEENLCQQFISVYGAVNSSRGPKLIITYEPGYFGNSEYRSHTHDIARFGQGNIDLACGNLMLNSDDFVWSGNRMPVSIRHMYNSVIGEKRYTKNTNIGLNVANFSAMNLGLGWRLNIMQSMVEASFCQNGTTYHGYVYIDENGEETYFKLSDKTAYNESLAWIYALYEDVSGNGMIYDPEKYTITFGDDVYSFDSKGRLIGISDKYNSMSITYSSDKITKVTDGAGRQFNFTYDSSNRLVSIQAPDETTVNYSYDTSNRISKITYSDGVCAQMQYYTGHNKIGAVQIIDADYFVHHKVVYEYNGERISAVTEYGSGAVQGAKTQYNYSVGANRTTVTTIDAEDTSKTVTKVYTFDDDGEIIGEYMYSETLDNVGSSGDASGIAPFADSGIISNIDNLLLDNGFEHMNAWTVKADNVASVTSRPYRFADSTHYGDKLLEIESTQDCTMNGLYQTLTLPSGQYAFSLYVRITSVIVGSDPGVFIGIYSGSELLCRSEKLTTTKGEWMRLVTPFELTETTTVNAMILFGGEGCVYADAAQLEKNSFANAYNMLQNSNFESDANGWHFSNAEISNDTCFNMSKSVKIVGDLDSQRFAYQSVKTNDIRSTRETYTLSGWAKGNALPHRERENSEDAAFRLRAVLRYYEGSNVTTEQYCADFSPCTDEWQFASIQFAKKQFIPVQSIDIYCEYNYNSGVAYFDNIQLVRDSIETGLTASDFVEEPEDDETIETYETENETESEVISAFEEAIDEFGNRLTETTFTDGEFGTIYRSFEYNASGNDLLYERDALNNRTTYTVDEATSRNKEVFDRCNQKTAYEYDDNGNITKVTSYEKTDVRFYTERANVSYTYDDLGNLSAITRGDGMTYNINYDVFHNLANIGIDGKTEKLVNYNYKSGSGRLKSVTYANGDKMEATYNNIGQMTYETWTDTAGNVKARYRYMYDGSGNIVSSLDILANKEYNYIYENGILVRTTESDVVLNVNGYVVSKNLVNTVTYTYNADDQLIKKRIISASGEETVYCFEDIDGNTVLRFTAGGKNVVSHSKTDSFGRKVFDEIQLGTGFVSREFSYHSGRIDEQHTENGKLKSAPTSQLVSEIRFDDGRTLSYVYDGEERITQVTETYIARETEVGTFETASIVTNYRYDALGQLISEKVNDVAVNEMTYDYYGNILTKNGKSYIYDTVWKDLLVSYDGQSITYDAQGNPVTYLGHNLTWEKGRQLKSFDGITYTYNANGIRTSKTVNGVQHVYTLDGTKILREAWGANTLIPLYDNEDSVCGIIYNGTPYYFYKNLQGDVVAITDSNGSVVARYTYDAWGVCTAMVDGNGFDVSDELTHIANINPFRYKGYYFDSEIGMYYLQSRYYNPVIGRFVNGDDSSSLELANSVLDNDLYAYTTNSPILLTDNCGEGWLVDKLKKVVTSVKTTTTAVTGWATKTISNISSAIKDVADNLKTFVQNLANYIKNQFKKFSSKVSCHFNKGRLRIPTTPIGYLIDAVITTISGLVKGALLKGAFSLLKTYFKNNKPKLRDFIINTVLPILKNSDELLRSLIQYIAKRFQWKCALTITKSKIQDRIWGHYDAYKWLSAVSSTGSFVATFLDILDGTWDNYLSI